MADGVPCEEIDDATTTFESADPMGPVSEGRIVMSCFTTRGRVSRRGGTIRIGGQEMDLNEDTDQWFEDSGKRANLPE
jgi:hypothetical protein